MATKDPVLGVAMPELVVRRPDHRETCFLCYGVAAVQCPGCGQGWCSHAIAWVMLCALCGTPLPWPAGGSRMFPPSNLPSGDTIARRIDGLSIYADELIGMVQ